MSLSKLFHSFLFWSRLHISETKTKRILRVQIFISIAREALEITFDIGSITPSWKSYSGDKLVDKVIKILEIRVQLNEVRLNKNWALEQKCSQNLVFACAKFAVSNAFIKGELAGRYL